MSEVLVVKNVEKSYGAVKALNGVSMTVSKGSIVGLVGPNGAGKTTLMKISVGLLRRDSGVVLLNNRDPYFDHEARIGVGVVFERPILPDSMRVIDYLERASRIHNASRSDVKEAVKLAGLSGHEWKRFSELSAGLKQRAALAHALIANPHFIIADEPTSNLDPLERRRVMELIAELNRDKGITFLISSHVIAELINIVSNIVIISRGKIILEGPPDEILKRSLIARIRALNLDALISTLSREGFQLEQEGFTILVKLRDYSDYSVLLESLAKASRIGATVLSVDLAGVSIEEVLRAG